MVYIHYSGDLPDLVVIEDSTSVVGLTASITEDTKGSSSLTHFYLSHFGMITSAIPTKPTTSQV